MKSAVCCKCAEDSHLKELIKSGGQVRECSVCQKSDDAAFDVEQLAQRIEPILRDHFEQSDETPEVDDDGNESVGQAGVPLANVIESILGQYFSFENEIVEAAIRAENHRPEDGNIQLFDSSSSYVQKQAELYYAAKWKSAQNELKHSKRFFCLEALELFSELFHGIEAMGSNNENGSVVWELPEGSELFRARLFSKGRLLQKFCSDPFKHVRPPPPENARAGRMNAERVVLFYGALDIETCLAETRPYLWGNIVTIGLRTTRLLRLLDFTRLRKSNQRKLLSFFQPDFPEQVRRIEFLRHLQRLISKPVAPDRTAKYLITQAMAEYLAHVHHEPFDGILYESAQQQGGTNIVLFPLSIGVDDAANKFPISYIDNSVRLFFINSIEYGHPEKEIDFSNGAVRAEKLIDNTDYTTG